MKKIFITLLICIIIVGGVMFVTRSDFLYDKLAENFRAEEIPVSDLEITNSMYWYNTLSEEEQRIYRIIANGVMNLDKNITVDVTKENNFENTKECVDIALNAFFADHPDVFYINDKYEISFTDMLVIKKVTLKLEYISDNKQEIELMKEKLDTEIEKINSQISNAKTDYEKELLIHDILATEIQYFTNDDYNEVPRIKHTAYSALVEKSAVCDGITKAFQLLLNKNNIDNVFVTGVAEGVPHAWCKVKIDGNYYNVDITSDKVLNKERKDLIVHSYFNITDKEIMNTHQIDDYDKLPSSVENKYNYYVYSNYEITYFDNFEYKLGEIIKSQSSRKLIEFKVTGVSDIPAKMVDTLYNINFNNYKTNNITKVEYNKINDNYIVVK